ncbi:MAG: type VI secretion system-associated FHA domain protein TagH, partial [Zoogloea sp.]|nr:type VI secretion system-associated FHA domain protein TagH [Zoogloea sp.]
LLNQAFTPPRAEIPAGAELTQVVAPRPAGPRADDAAPAAPGAMVFSWDKAPPAASVPAAAAEAPPAPAARVELSAERVEAAAPESPLAAPAGHDVLMEAFLRGLGVPVRLPAGLNPELMEQIGVMLREATQGTLELLTARALTKREVRAEVTMIVSKGNNPLKFSPDVGFALSQLLAPQGRGFMPPKEAMRDAYDDLRAHQFGFMAGMRAALAGVLKRFEPAALEQRVVARSLLDNLLPGSRKARLWDLFEQMYGEISQEAEDDFHALFGREFLRAYEEQVERLQAEREPDR